MRITTDARRGYWLVAITCKDRNKLLFDTVCTLADMQYDVFHATIDSQGGVAMQEYWIKSCNGSCGAHLKPNISDAQHVSQAEQHVSQAEQSGGRGKGCKTAATEAGSQHRPPADADAGMHKALLACASLGILCCVAASTMANNS